MCQLSCRPSSTPQRLGQCCSQARLFEKLRNRNLKGFGQPIQDVHCRIFFLAFKAPDIRPINVGVICKPLLGKAAFDPDPP
jgi:hypothetical protein